MSKSVFRILSSTTRLGKYLTLIALALLLGYPANADASSAPQHSEKFHYKLIMSADDSFCKPLTTLYNDLLADLTNSYRGGQGFFYSEGGTRRTNFEVWEPEKFAKVGLLPPAKINDDVLKSGPYLPVYITQEIYRLDLFDEHKPRIFIVNDIEEGGSTYSYVEVLKKDATYNTVMADDPISHTKSMPTVDPYIIDRVINPPVAGTDGYMLRKWPKSSKFEPPTLDGTTTRVFLRSGIPYFIENEDRGLPLSENKESLILVYKLTPNDRQDICYLSIAPSIYDQ